MMWAGMLLAKQAVRFGLTLTILSATFFTALMSPRLAPTQGTTTAWSSVGPFGGRIFALTADRLTSGIFYAGTDNGVFKTLDEGLNWQQVNLPGKQIADIDIDYVAVQKRLYVAGAWGIVTRSADGGQTWEDISTGLTQEYINTLSVDSVLSDRVWVGTNHGVYAWNSATRDWKQTSLISVTHDIVARNGVIFAGVEGGVYKSVNNGASWSPINGDLPPGVQQRNISSLLVHPSDTRIIYAGTWYGGIFKTTDGGQHWNAMNQGMPAFTDIMDLAFSPTNSNIIFAAAYGYFNTDLAASGVFKSTDGGLHWAGVSPALFNKYTSALAPHPTDVSVIYAGTLGSGVFRGTNGGTTWAQRVRGLAGLQINAIVPAGDSLYAATNYDGIYRSTDQGRTWNRFNNGLPPITLFALAIAKDEQGNIFIGVSLQGVLRLNAGTWIVTANALPQTEVWAIAAVAGTLIIAATTPEQQQVYEILISTDNGKTWMPRNSGLPANPFRIRSLSVQRGSGSTTIFASTSKGIYRTALSPISWTKTSSGMLTEDVNKVVVDPTNSNILYAATCGGYLYKSVNGGASWEQRKEGLSAWCVRAVAVDPTNANVVLAGGDYGVYQSITGGSFWSQIGSGGLLFSNVTDILILADSSLLAGAISGNWRSGSVGSPAATPTPSGTISWTVMVYLNGDNNLDPSTFEAFNNLELAAYNRNINIIALWDRRHPLGGDTYEYLVQPDNNPYRLADSYELNVNYWERGEQNMGSPVTLINFVNDARDNYPADHYLLSIIDHGGGWSAKVFPDLARTRWFQGGSGLSWDETNDSHYLSTFDMKRIFEQIRQADAQHRPIDIVFYDACLMGMFEEAYQLRNNVQYLVASENQSWASFPYDAYLGTIGPGTTPKALAIDIVNKYHNSLPGYPRTMAAIDLSNVDVVRVALNNLAGALIQGLPSARPKIAAAFQTSQKFDYDSDLALSDNEGYVDLKDFVGQLIAHKPGTDIEHAAQSLLAAINDPQQRLIVHERHESNTVFRNKRYFDLDGAQGISIYLPLGETDEELQYYVPSQLDFAADTLWDDFIFTYLQQFPPQSGGRGSGRGNIPMPLSITQHVYLPLTRRN